jgi:protein-arginine kinase activator protein McsA
MRGKGKRESECRWCGENLPKSAAAFCKPEHSRLWWNKIATNYRATVQTVCRRCGLTFEQTRTQGRPFANCEGCREVKKAPMQKKLSDLEQFERELMGD